MAEIPPPSSKSSIDMKDISIKSASGVAIFWVLDKVLKSRDNYMEYVQVALAGATGLTIIAPILNNLINGATTFSSLTFDAAFLKNILIEGGITGVLYYILKMFFGDKISDSLMYRYIAVIVSIIGADVLTPFLMSKWGN